MWWRQLTQIFSFEQSSCFLVKTCQEIDWAKVPSGPPFNYSEMVIKEWELCTVWSLSYLWISNKCNVGKNVQFITFWEQMTLVFCIHWSQTKSDYMSQSRWLQCCRPQQWWSWRWRRRPRRGWGTRTSPCWSGGSGRSPETPSAWERKLNFSLFKLRSKSNWKGKTRLY